MLFDSRQSKSRQLQMGQTHLSTFLKYSFCSAPPSWPACLLPTAYSIPKTKYPILFYEGQHIKCLKMSEDSSRYLLVTIISLIPNVLII